MYELTTRSMRLCGRDSRKRIFMVLRVEIVRRQQAKNRTRKKLQQLRVPQRIQSAKTNNHSPGSVLQLHRAQKITFSIIN